MDIARFLKNIFLFDSFSDDEIKKIAGFSTLVKYRPGNTLFSDGEKASAFFAVVSGKLKTFKMSRGGLEQILHVQKPFDLIAEASIFDKGTYPASCVAMEEAQVVRISGDDFRSLILRNPDIALKLLKSYSRRLRSFVSLVNDLSLRDVKGRLSKYLMKYAVKKGSGLVLDLNLSKKELSSLLGTIPETLSRTLKFFKKAGLISEKKKQIVIIRPQKLRELFE